MPLWERAVPGNAGTLMECGCVTDLSARNKGLAEVPGVGGGVGGAQAPYCLHQMLLMIEWISQHQHCVPAAPTRCLLSLPPGHKPFSFPGIPEQYQSHDRHQDMLTCYYTQSGRPLKLDAYQLPIIKLNSR